MSFEGSAVFDALTADFYNQFVFAEGPERVAPAQAGRDLAHRVRPLYPPPSHQPCANVTGTVCEKDGTKTCTGCRIVSYCSLECQNAHWRAHKRDCRSPLLSPSWQPEWKVQGRKPSFSTDNRADRNSFRMWNNMPPMDVIKLKNNENDSSKDLAIAFTDAGDIRSVIKTVNSLPDDFTGSLDVVINEPDPLVATRNLALISLLGHFPHDIVSVDGAIHYWFSAFVPYEYGAAHGSCFQELLSSNLFKISFGDVGSSVSMGLSDVPGERPEWFSDFKNHFSHVLRTVPLTYDQATAIRKSSCYPTPDDRDRIYCQNRPGNRVSIQRYLDSGIVYPFGSQVYQIRSPNPYLFSASGSWSPPKAANPLHGWNMFDIFLSGHVCGSQLADSYGCLYFYLAIELNKFRHRIRSKFRVAFHVMSLSANALAACITRHMPSLRFDRIDVGRTIDHAQAGLKAVLDTWAPYLAVHEHAVIIGHCTKWVEAQKDGTAKGAGDETVRQSLRRVVENMKGETTVEEILSRAGVHEGLFFSLYDSVEMGYDNSDPFSRYIKSQGIGDVLKQTGLKMRQSHKVAPYRLGVPSGKSASDVPEWEQQSDWVASTMMNSYSWSERFLEFSRDQ